MKTITINNQEFTAEYNPLDWQKMGLQYTASGYGKKIPTAYVVDFQGKVRRIYCTIYGNSGSSWITVNGKKVYVR